MEQTVKQAVIFATVSGFVFWLLSINWVMKPLLEKAEAPMLLSLLVFSLICLWQAVPYAALGFCYTYFRWQERVAGPFLAAATVTVAWVVWPTYIPGLPLHALYRSPEFLAVLDLSGTSSLLFLSTLFCFSACYCLNGEKTHRIKYLALIVVMPCLMLGYGKLREHQYQSKLQDAGEEQWLKIAYIQPSLIRPAPTDTLYTLSEKAIEQYSPDLLVWPELSIVYSLVEVGDDRRGTIALARKYQQDLLVASGYVYAKDDKVGQMRTYYNRVHLIKDGRVAGEYSKQLLVPFSEYMPKSLEFLRAWMPGVNYFRAGKNQQPIAYNKVFNLGVVVCYEAIFPELVRKQVAMGANVIINPVSDTLFGSTDGGAYHLSLAYFRSIENRVPLVRVANTGASMIVGANGKLLGEPTAHGEVIFSASDVFLPRRGSLYSRVGDWLSAFLFLLLTSASLIALWHKKYNI